MENSKTEIKCKKCEEPLTQTNYAKPKQPFIVILTSVIIVSVGMHQITKHFDTNRYPISVEHSILENCISSYDEPLRASRIKNKKDVCVCAFYKTLKEYDYEEFKKNQYDFLNTFENKSRECI